MENRTHNFEEDLLASERAFGWLRRLETGDARDAEAFHTWVSRSPQNGGEVLIATSTEIVMRQVFRNKRMDVERFLATSANVLSIDDHSGSLRPPQRPRRLRLFSVAGVGVAAATAVLFLTLTVVRSWLQTSEYTTAVGEQRAIQLPDGSAIAINTQSSVRVAFTSDARDVYLEQGQAMFTVAKDASRPFRVHVSSADGGAAIIQALGTKFDVRRRVDRIKVAVVEGVVQVRSKDSVSSPGGAPLAEIGATAKVAAGQAVSIEATGQITPPTYINLSDVSAWQHRRLVFTDDTLEDIAKEFARYNRTPQIRVEGDEIRLRRISGVFDADSPEGLLKYLALDSSVALDRTDDGVVVIRPRLPPERSTMP